MLNTETILLIISGSGVVVWYFYRQVQEWRDDRITRQDKNLNKHQSKLSSEIEGLGDKIDNTTSELHRLRADVQSEHKDMWRTMSTKADKEELKQHRAQTNKAIESVRFDVQSVRKDLVELINAKVDPIANHVKALYNHMLNKKDD